MCAAAIWWSGIARIVYGCTLVEAADLGYGTLDLQGDLALAIERRRIPAERLLVSRRPTVTPFKTEGNH